MSVSLAVLIHFWITTLEYSVWVWAGMSPSWMNDEWMTEFALYLVDYLVPSLQISLYLIHTATLWGQQDQS